MEMRVTPQEASWLGAGGTGIGFLNPHGFCYQPHHPGDRNG